MSRPDAASILPPVFAVDTSRRATQGIRISLRPRAAVAPLAESPADQAPLGSLDYAVVDVETTGGSARRGHRVTEIAIVRMRADGAIVDEFTTLINPERPIPPFITALTSITAEMVAGAPRFGDVLERLRTVLDGAVFVAHNAAFDWRFVSAELERADGGELGGRMLCTLRMARRLVPEIPRRSLDALTMYFGLANEARHRAYGDARATAMVLRRLLARAADREVRSWHELEALLRWRAARRKRVASPTAVADA